jgi:DNA-directed RNA polymerase specialized sigma24 family protein
MSASDVFETTRWSQVLAAKASNQPRAREALAALCQTYWYPMYVYIRRLGHGPDDAEDLTQSFFAELLRPGALAGVQPSKGKFRAFLLACCRHFLSHQRDHDRAQKRGGGRPTVSIDVRDAEDRYRNEPVDNISPEALFDRRWALTLLESVFGDLRADYAGRGKSALFEALKPQLTGGSEPPRLAEVAARLGMTEGAVQVAAHRLRGRYREALLTRIGVTVSDPAEVEEEIRDLFAAVAL